MERAKLTSGKKTEPTETKHRRLPANKAERKPKADKLLCRYCGSDDLAPSFIKRRDRRCRNCFSKRYSSAARERRRRAKSSAKRRDRGSSAQTLGPFPSLYVPVCGELLIFKQNQQFATDRKGSLTFVPPAHVWNELAGRSTAELNQSISYRQAATEVNRVVSSDEPLFTVGIDGAEEPLDFYLRRCAPPLQRSLDTVPAGYLIAGPRAMEHGKYKPPKFHIALTIPYRNDELTLLRSESTKNSLPP